MSRSSTWEKTSTSMFCEIRLEPRCCHVGRAYAYWIDDCMLNYEYWIIVNHQSEAQSGWQWLKIPCSHSSYMENLGPLRAWLCSDLFIKLHHHTEDWGAQPDPQWSTTLFEPSQLCFMVILKMPRLPLIHWTMLHELCYNKVISHSGILTFCK